MRRELPDRTRPVSDPWSLRMRVVVTRNGQNEAPHEFRLALRSDARTLHRIRRLLLLLAAAAALIHIG